MKTDEHIDNTKVRPVVSELNQNQRILSNAYALVEDQIASGTVSAQVLSRILHENSAISRETLRKLELESERLRLLIAQQGEEERTQAMLQEVLEALRSYRVSP